MRFRMTAAVACLILPLAQPVTADVLLIDSIHQAPINSDEGLPRPHRGMTMDQVRQRYGAPDIEYPWVGDPPITRWDYSSYSVFFEYQHVLTAVVHH